MKNEEEMERMRKHQENILRRKTLALEMRNSLNQKIRRNSMITDVKSKLDKDSKIDKTKLNTIKT